MEDMGVEVKVLVNTDSSAAKIIAPRTGAGRVRHIEVRELRVLGRVSKGEISIAKVRGEQNVADGLAKHVDRQRKEQYIAVCGMVRRSGRRELGPRLGDGT